MTRKPTKVEKKKKDDFYKKIESILKVVKDAYTNGHEFKEFVNLEVIRFVVIRRMMYLLKEINKPETKHVVHVDTTNGNIIPICNENCYLFHNPMNMQAK